MFGSLEDIEQALEGIFGNRIHNKFIKVFRSSKEQFRNYLDAMAFGSSKSPKMDQSGPVANSGIFFCLFAILLHTNTHEKSIHFIDIMNRHVWSRVYRIKRHWFELRQWIIWGDGSWISMECKTSRCWWVFLRYKNCWWKRWYWHSKKRCNGSNIFCWLRWRATKSISA